MTNQTQPQRTQYQPDDRVWVDCAALTDTRMDTEPTRRYVAATVMRVNSVGQVYICTENGNMLFVWSKFVKPFVERA